MKYFSAILFVLFLSSCSSSKSPVSSRVVVDASSESEKIGGKIITIVHPRETWYSIAFEHSLSVTELAAWNGLTPSDDLLVGKRLRLSRPFGFKSQVNKPADMSLQIEISPVVVSSSGKSSSAVISNPSKVAKSEKNTPEPTIAKASFVSWAWPIRGEVVKTFSVAKGQKGVDLAGQYQQTVKAAAAGKVVYQGNGIKGYKNLIIIKHNNQMLSAYAYSDAVFVTEGQQIKKGQHISSLGLKNGKPLLHFEIRKDGKPVNPLSYLK